MSALVPAQIESSAALLAHYDAVRRRLLSAPTPEPKPQRVRPKSPFHPDRVRAAAWAVEGPPPVIYDFGPGHIGLMIGRLRPSGETKCRHIATEVALKHMVGVEEIFSIRRHVPSVAARYETFWRCRHETNMSLPAIGKVFNRDHTTVLHGIRQHQRKIDGLR
jgi:hypothetical protein